MNPKLKFVGMKIDDGVDVETIGKIVGNKSVGIYAERRGGDELKGGYVGIRPLE